MIFSAAALSVFVSAPAFAQDEGPEPEAEAATEAAPESGQKASSALEAELSLYPARRGFYVTGDLGGYFSFGGISTSSGDGFPSRSTSNFQPVVGINVGYDVLSSPTMNLAVALRGAMTFNAGSSPVSQEEALAVGGVTNPADFDMAQVGVASKLGFLLVDRLFLNIVGDVGAGFITPDPNEPALTSAPGTSVDDQIINPNAGSTAVGVIFGVGAGLEFNTLFPGFSIGLDARFQGAVASSQFIPGMSFTVPLKYTFE